MVVSSSAVTTASISLSPTDSSIAPLAEPLETVTPFTVTVAPDWFTVGVSFTCVTELPTVAK